MNRLNHTALAGCLLLLSSLGSLLFAQTTQAQARTILERGNSGEPNSLDPHKMKLLSELTILRDLFEGLSKSDADGRIIPGAAASWETSEGGKVYTFHLRENLKWSDGQALTADDFVAGYRRLFDPATAAQAAAFLYTIKNAQAINAGQRPVQDLGVTAPDPSTVRIELRAPNPTFPTLILSGYTSPFPRHAFKIHGKDWIKAGNLVSNGPFKMGEWAPHTYIQLEKNPHYHDADKVVLTQVIFHPITDGSTSIKQFRAGELDITALVPVSRIEHLRKILPDNLHTVPDLAVQYLVPNMATDGLDDIRVRRALSLAINRRIMADKVMRGMGVPAWRFSPASVSSYAPGDMALKDRSMKEREEEARALLHDAGYGADNPFKVQLRTTDAREAGNVVVALRAMWQKIGVETEIYNTEVKTHYTDLGRGNFEIAVASYYGWDDPNEFLSLFTAATGQMSFNYGRYDNPAYDAALNEALEIAEIAQRHARMAEAEHIMLDDLAVIPLFFPINRSLVSSRIQGYRDNALNVHPSEYISISDE